MIINNIEGSSTDISNLPVDLLIIYRGLGSLRLSTSFITFITTKYSHLYSISHLHYYYLSYLCSCNLQRRDMVVDPYHCHDLEQLVNTLYFIHVIAIQDTV